MFKVEAIEAEPIVVATLNEILEWAPTKGRPGSDLRRAIGDLKVHCQALLMADRLGPPLVECFNLALDVGITLPQIMAVRATAWAFDPRTVGAIVVQDSLIELCLACVGDILARMKFESRKDVEVLNQKIGAIFAEIEEDIADKLESATYRALIGLHAAIISYLVETARPLPDMLKFRFGYAQPTLVMAYKLYADAGRADELLRENEVIHPGFALPYGRALSE